MIFITSQQSPVVKWCMVLCILLLTIEMAFSAELVTVSPTNKSSASQPLSPTLDTTIKGDINNTLFLILAVVLVVLVILVTIIICYYKDKKSNNTSTKAKSLLPITSPVAPERKDKTETVKQPVLQEVDDQTCTAITVFKSCSSDELVLPKTVTEDGNDKSLHADDNQSRITRYQTCFELDSNKTDGSSPVTAIADGSQDKGDSILKTVTANVQPMSDETVKNELKLCQNAGTASNIPVKVERKADLLEECVLKSPSTSYKSSKTSGQTKVTLAKEVITKDKEALNNLVTPIENKPEPIVPVQLEQNEDAIESVIKSPSTSKTTQKSFEPHSSEKPTSVTQNKCEVGQPIPSQMVLNSPSSSKKLPNNEPNQDQSQQLAALVAKPPTAPSKVSDTELMSAESNVDDKLDSVALSQQSSILSKESSSVESVDLPVAACKDSSEIAEESSSLAIVSHQASSTISSIDSNTAN